MCIHVLQHVNPQKATGPDGFKGKVLKECAIGACFYTAISAVFKPQFCPTHLEIIHNYSSAEKNRMPTLTMILDPLL